MFAVLNEGVRVALLKKCNLSRVEGGAGVSGADVRMDGIAGAETLREGRAGSAHGTARRSVSGAEGSGESRMEEQRQESQITEGLGGHCEDWTLDEVRMCCRVLSRRVPSSDLVLTGSLQLLC